MIYQFDDIIKNHSYIKKSFWYELFLLLFRGILINLRNKKILALRIGQNMIVGLLVAALYYNVIYNIKIINS